MQTREKGELGEKAHFANTVTHEISHQQQY
jgi:hypothetical protein